MQETCSKLRFGAFEFDTASLELYKRGIKLKISGQPMQILALLLETPGEVVTRETIRQRLWASDTYVDFEHSLNAAVNKLREALSDDSARPRFIATVPRRGYRFLEDVVPVSTEATPTANPTTSRSPVRSRMVAGAMLGVLICAAIALLVYRAERDKDSWRVSIAREAQITTSPELAMYPTISPDATRLAYSVDRGGGFEIMVRQIDNDEQELQLTKDGQQNIQPAWSPDGQSILYYSRNRGGIWKMPAMGGTPRRISSFGSHPSWSPDGKWIAFQSGPVNDLGADSPGVYAPSAIWIVRPDGTEPRQITRAGNPDGGHGAPSWSPDGRHIVFVSVIAAMGLFTVDVESGAVTTLQRTASIFLDPVYAADGKSVFYGMMNKSGIGLYQLPLTASGTAVAGPPVQLKSGETRVRNLSLSRDGTKLFYSGVTPVSGLWSISKTSNNRFGESVVLRQRIGDRTTLPRFSPDGKRLLAAAWRTGVCCEIWMMDSDGKEATMLSTEGIHPNWFPDGKDMLFVPHVKEALGNVPLNKLNVESRQSMKIAEIPPQVQTLHLSKDGRQVVYQSSTNGVVNLWVLNLATGARKQLTFSKDFMGFPEWAPDGQQIAANAKRSDDDQAMVVSVKDGRISQVTSDAGQHWPSSWTRDGKELIMAAQHSGVWNVYSLDLATRKETPLTHYTIQNEYVRYPQLSPTGKQIVYEYTETRGNIWMLTLKQDGK